MPPSGHTKPHVLVIGALGGSGTRAVADAFSRIGYVHGPALNRSRDCLSFTYLFVRTGWMDGPVPSVADRLAVLRRVAVSGTAPEAPPLDRLTDAVTERVPPAGSQRSGHGFGGNGNHIDRGQHTALLRFCGLSPCP